MLETGPHKAHHPQTHSPKALLPRQLSVRAWAWLATLEGWAAWGLCRGPGSWAEDAITRIQGFPMGSNRLPWMYSHCVQHREGYSINTLTDTQSQSSEESPPLSKMALMEVITPSMSKTSKMSG